MCPCVKLLFSPVYKSRDTWALFESIKVEDANFVSIISLISSLLNAKKPF
jgi:hypothetical protein